MNDLTPFILLISLVTANTATAQTPAQELDQITHSTGKASDGGKMEVGKASTASDAKSCENNNVPETPSPPAGAPKADPVLKHASQAAASAEGIELIDGTIDAEQILAQARSADYKVLSQAYSKLPQQQVTENLRRAHQNLSESASTLENSAGGIDSAQKIRLQNDLLNARDKAAATLGALSKPEGASGAAAEASNALDELLNGKSGARSLADGLANRQILFNGLPKQVQQTLLGQLTLVENPTVRLKNGDKRELTILHNGLLNAGGNIPDCASLVEALLSPQIRKISYTSLDLRTMWIYRRTGKFENPPVYDPKRAEVIKKAAAAFIPLSVYEGDTLRAGDILFYRTPWEAKGYVFLIKDFDPISRKAQVIDADTNANANANANGRSLRQSEFPLLIGSGKQKSLRHGLLALRLNPTNNTGCVYKDRKKGEHL